MDRAEDILAFWFGELADEHDVGGKGSLWWGKDPDTDGQIRARFGQDHRQACAGELEAWAGAPRSRLALVILIDQLSRNLHRDKGEAFAHDGVSQRLTLDAIERGFDRELRSVERAFLYMPLMHAESIELQHRSLDAFAKLAGEVPAERRSPFENYHRFAVKHAIIVSRFGRYPHRNALLGRASAPEELAFLQQPGSSF